MKRVRVYKFFLRNDQNRMIPHISFSVLIKLSGKVLFTLMKTVKLLGTLLKPIIFKNLGMFFKNLGM